MITDLQSATDEQKENPFIVYEFNESNELE